MASETEGMQPDNELAWNLLIHRYLSAECDIKVVKCMELEIHYCPVESEDIDTYRKCAQEAKRNQTSLVNTLRSHYCVFFNLFIKEARRILEEEVESAWCQEWTNVLGNHRCADSQSLVEIANRTRAAFQMSDICTRSWNTAWESFDLCRTAHDTIRENLEGTNDKWWEIFKYQKLEFFSEYYAGGYGKDVFRLKLERCLSELWDLERDMIEGFEINPRDFSQGPIRREVRDKFEAFLSSVQGQLVSGRGEHGHSDLRGKLGELDRALEKYKREHAGLQTAWVLMIVNFALRKSHPELANAHLEDDGMEID